MAKVYFNENDPFAAKWIGNLYPQAKVDTRSIADVQGCDTEGFDRCHFFGGIAGWEYALQLAGWPEGRQVWTGSCPCQPFSICGKKGKESDERHLWPEFLRLIQEQRPAVVFGEQVAPPDGREWLAGVRADLEALGYQVGAADLCAAGVGSPHIRQRLYWMAYSDGGRLEESYSEIRRPLLSDTNGTSGGLGDPSRERSQGLPGDVRDISEPRWDGANPNRPAPETGDVSGGMGNPSEQPRERQPGSISGAEEKVGGEWKLDGHLHLGPKHAGSGVGQWPRQTDGFWGTADWIFCRDGRWRRIEPGSFPLASRIPARVGRIRGYGNSIVPQLAAKFIQASMEAISLNATT